jgi:AcrR family transcriptional regulator
MTDGRRLRGEATRERLVSAARELFGARGYDATAVEDVLAAAGVARGALYHHFASKSALFDAVAEEVFAEIARRTDAAARAGDADALERIRRGCQAWLEMALDPAVQRTTLLDPPTVLGWERWRGLDERHTLGGLRTGFAQLESEGRIPHGEGELFAHLLLAALNEAALFIASSADARTALATARSTVDTLLDRLASARA